jgi:Tol biopolymer transport system component
MNADGTDARARTDTLQLRGSPAWSPDGRSVTIAAVSGGAPKLHRIFLNGETAVHVQEYSVDASWAPRADFLIYTGPDIGTSVELKAATAGGTAHHIPRVVLPRGAKRARFVQDGRAIVVMRGDIEHKDLWLIDLQTGAERPLTRLPAGFTIRDFDVSPDGREIVVERVQDQSDIVLVDRGRIRD